jgi:hypothetical protein
MARRAAERSAHLVDRVIPIVPVRHWVLTFPFRVRYLLAWSHELLLEVLRVFADALLSFYRDQAEAKGIVGKAGMITISQRFGGSGNLNPHGHVSALDGVFSERKDGSLQFHEASVPKQKDITVLCSIIRARVLDLFVKKDLLAADAEAGTDPFVEDEPLLAQLSGASASSVVAAGPRAGSPVLRLRTLPAKVQTRKREHSAHIDGFDLHAGAALGPHDRKALEALLRYQLRPPFARNRLTLLDDGRIKLALRSPYDDGTSHIVLTKRDFVARLAALVPRPKKNLIIHYGCLAPNASRRADIVAFGRPGSPTPAEPTLQGLLDRGAHRR